MRKLHTKIQVIKIIIVINRCYFIIIIIIKYIYIVQNHVMQLMRWINSHTANKNVFSLCLNVSTEMSVVESKNNNSTEEK